MSAASLYEWVQVSFFMALAFPLLSMVLAQLIPERNERAIHRVVLGAALGQMALTVLGVAAWIAHGGHAIDVPEFELYGSEAYVFLIDLYFDGDSAAFLVVGSLLYSLIIRYSSAYLHQEPGYRRYFVTVSLFYFGYVWTLLSGNFETLFVGWEVLGFSSFLLIAFYRTRYLPVRNAVKVFSIYRIGDVGILLAMWASHHLWHENITFAQLHNAQLVLEHLEGHSLEGMFISLALLVAASVKSAQGPFASWLPRAMEGPTPSSAIFYGSLAVHMGVFLLLRTAPFWEHQVPARILIGLLGLVTAILSFFTARVQSNIKSQIAYSSIVQIGLMFLELALGWHALVLFHAVSNALLRSYQLLASPSVVSYRIRDQFYHHQEQVEEPWSWIPETWRLQVQRRAILEWHLDRVITRLVFKPVKALGHRLDFLNGRNVAVVLLPCYGIGWAAWWMQEDLPAALQAVLPSVFAALAMALVFRAFTERKSAGVAWLLVVMSHLWVALAVSLNEHFGLDHVAWYLSGIAGGAVLGGWVLVQIKRQPGARYGLSTYQGQVAHAPVLHALFIPALLSVMGFPISLSFIGEDLIFSHIHADQPVLATLNAITFIFGGIALVRLYARLFLGPDVRAHIGVPNRTA
jgi:NADH:ubiquinone oxidoreductase subunit 5 (subunit L)/multisubunit Na+/H+ antiporter MnhA subunit